MITYEPLWQTMKRKKITQYRLIKYYGISSGQIHRLKRNKYVSTHTIGMLCTILKCRVDDIMEFRPDNSEYSFRPTGVYGKHLASLRETGGNPQGRQSRRGP